MVKLNNLIRGFFPSLFNQCRPCSISRRTRRYQLLRPCKTGLEGCDESVHLHAHIGACTP